MVQLLLAEGAKLNSRDKYGRTPLHRPVISNYRRIIRELLKQGAYSYLNVWRDKSLVRYWRVLHGEIDLDQSFYTTLLLAGVSTENNVLPAPLDAIQRAIESTVREWLAPLDLSEETCARLAPHVLRALSRLLEWVAIVTHVEAQATRETKSAQYYPNLLLESASKDSNNFLVFKGVKALAQELQDSIQAHFTQKTLKPLTTFLEKTYRLSSPVAYHLITKAAHSKEYFTFHKGLFTHHWKTPLPAPTTRLPQYNAPRL